MQYYKDDDDEQKIFMAGSHVRIIKGNQCRRGMIALEDDNNHVDIIYDKIDSRYDNQDDEDDEELRVDRSRLMKLFPFEMEYENKNFTFDEYHQHVSEFIRIKDYTSAITSQLKMLSKLGNGISVGAVICVCNVEFNDKGAFEEDSFLATISTIEDDGSSIEVFLDDDTEREINTKQYHVVALPNQCPMCLQYVNICLAIVKNALKIEPARLRIAIAYTTITIAICNSIIAKECQIDASTYPEDATELLDYLFNAYMLRSRSNVLLNKLRAAAIDIKQAVMLKPKDMSARKMVKIIQQRQLHEEKQNKILVRNITKWVDSAMKTHTAMTQQNDDNL